MSRPRTLAPIILLAASLGTASASPTTDTEGYPVVGNAMSKSPRPQEPSPELVKLRDRLLETSPAVVKKDLRPFRALCDSAGYPLVGNATTASKAERVQPSEYCTLVRDEAATHTASRRQ